MLTGSMQMVMIDPDIVLVKELEYGVEVYETIISDNIVYIPQGCVIIQ